MVAASLIDTNVLVYRFDTRFPKKQAIATKLLREGLSTDSIRIPPQTCYELYYRPYGALRTLSIPRRLSIPSWKRSTINSVKRLSKGLMSPKLWLSPHFSHTVTSRKRHLSLWARSPLWSTLAERE
jgi:hypothetical protein